MSLSLISPEGIVLDLNPNTVVQMEFVNSAFDEEILKGSYSYSFQIPQTDRNKLFFEFANEIASNSGYQNEYPNFTLQSGLIQIRCKLYLRDISKDAFNVNLFTDSGAFAEQLKKIKLNEIDIGSEALSSGHPYFKIKINSGGSGNTPIPDWEVQTATIIWSDQNGIVQNLLYGFQYNDTLANCFLILANRINNYNPPTYWSATRQVQIHEIVIDPDTDIIYQHLDTFQPAPVGTPLTDWDYFVNVSTVGTWNYDRNQQGIFNWWAYDQFNMDKRAIAQPLGEFMIILDPLDNQDRFLDTSQLASFSDNNPDTNYQYIENYVFSQGDPYVMYGNAVTGFMNGKLSDAPTEGDVKFFPIKNPTWSANTNYKGIVNYWKGDSFYSNTSTDYDETYSCSAQVRALYALEKLHEYLGLEFVADDITQNGFLSSLVVYNNFSNDRIVNRQVPYQGETEYDAFPEVFNFADNLPRIPIAEFLNGFRSMFFLGCWFDVFQSKVYWRPLKNVLSDLSVAIDLSHLVGPITEISYSNPDGWLMTSKNDPSDAVIQDLVVGDLGTEDVTVLSDVNFTNQLPSSQIDGAFCLVKSTETWYKNVKQIDGTFEWNYYSKDLYNLKLGNGQTAYSVPGSTTLMYMGTETAIEQGYEWKVPYVSQPRYSKNYEEKTESTLRFLSYAGLVENPYDENNQYPLATNNLYREMGQLYPSSPGGSLKWGGEFGIYNQFGKEWLSFFETAKQFSVSFPINESVLSQLKPWLPIKIRNQYFLYSNLKVNFPLESGLAEIKLYLIK